MNTDIEDAGFKDQFVGGALFKALNVPNYEFQADPIKAEKLKTIAKYLNDHIDPHWVIERLRNNKSSMSSLDFLASYSLLGMQRAEHAEKLKAAEAEMKKYE